CRRRYLRPASRSPADSSASRHLLRRKVSTRVPAGASADRTHRRDKLRARAGDAVAKKSRDRRLPVSKDRHRSSTHAVRDRESTRPSPRRSKAQETASPPDRKRSLSRRSYIASRRDPAKSSQLALPWKL